MSTVSLLLSAVMFLLVPACAGYAVCRLLGLKQNPASCFLYGCMAEWAFLQLLSVPLAYYRTSLTPVVIGVSAFLGICAAAGIVLLLKKRRLPRQPRGPEKRDFADWFALVVMTAGFIALAVITALRQYINSDDVHFVVPTLDMLLTNRLYALDPSTGLENLALYNGFNRLICSPWGVYMAYACRVTGLHPAVFAHSFIPQITLLATLCAYWLSAETFFPKSLFARCSLVIIAFTAALFAAHSTYNEGTFTILRAWQGKSTFAAVGIPTLYLAFYRIWDEPRGWKPYLQLYMICLACCHMSAMGIILGGIVCGGFGFVYAIAKKRITVALKAWIGLAICLAYYGVYRLV